MKVTVGKLRTCRSLATQLKGIKSPFGYACLKAETLINTAVKTYDEEIEKKRHEWAELNEDKSYKEKIGKDGKSEGLILKKENMDKLNEIFRTQNETEVNYEPYIATNIEAVKNDLVLLDTLNTIIVNVDIEQLYCQVETKEPLTLETVK